MNKTITKIFLILTFLFTSSCGYKVLEHTKTNMFNIKEVRAYGDKRINFKIKNSLTINSSEKDKQNLIVEINTKKTKSIKEKNIENQISKYEISISSNVKLIFLESNNKKEYNTISRGSYVVADKYFTTLKNEKRLIDNLTEDLSKQIINKINQAINDF
jgi:outer membrane lipopolysaccharide assembly protein LptE/RlpB